MKIESYINNSLTKIVNRLDGDRVVKQKFGDNGQLLSMDYYQQGQRHREANLGPAEIFFYDNGILGTHSYWQDGLRHREVTRGPAEVSWYEDGQIHFFTYYKNGKRHRPANLGPAEMIWYGYLSGQLKTKSYWQDGKIHRDVDLGPAYINWDRNGQLQKQLYYQHGQQMNNSVTKNVGEMDDGWLT